MPRLIAPGEGEALSLADLIDALDAANVDPCDEDAFASLGPLLARLARNRHFLADLAVAELKDRCRHQRRTNHYGAQVMLLRPTAGHYGLRANFWPALSDGAVKASGTEPFFYGHAHDHNFDFLTVGYLGPGYWSDHYEADYAALARIPGEPAGLRFIGRQALGQGQVMLYRRHRDVHAQLPPDSFSVSLNILGYGAEQCWFDQYRFDPAADTIVAGLTTTPSQVLLAAAVGIGCDNARDLAENFARTHPSDRMRLTAIDALAGTGCAQAVYEHAAGDFSDYVAGHARLRLAEINRSVSDGSS